jgi:hypothetical protein
MDDLSKSSNRKFRIAPLNSPSSSSAMRVRVRASQLVKEGRRFIDWVIEVDTVRSWRVLRSFRDVDQCRAFLVALPPGDNIEFVTP